jgi:hypothetical protein
MTQLGSTAIFDWKEAEQYLLDHGVLAMWQCNFCPLAADKNSRMEWAGNPDFHAWLDKGPDWLWPDWKVYVLNVANTEEYKRVTNKSHSPPACDGKTQDMPGTKVTIWNPEKTETVFIREWPESEKWVVCGPEWGIDEGKWYDPSA